MIEQNDTIAAISTPQGEGGIGIIRISGLGAFKTVKKLFVNSKMEFISSIEINKVTYGYLIDPSSKHKIDEVLLLAWKAPNSYTREDIVEIHCHGGIFLVNTVLSLVLEHGARVANPGEFTQRAFLNGRIDLAQAEAVADLITADSKAALSIAASHLEGKLSIEISAINNILIDVTASIEASIEFPDDEIESTPLNPLKNKILKAIKILDLLINSYFKGKIFRDGVKVVITGSPNVGKSSLLNALIMENRAIVTPYPGTTRDIIEESLNINGIKFRFKDTAGIRSTEEEIEKEGIKRTKQAIEDADIIIFVLDYNKELSEDDLNNFKLLENKQFIIAINKIDLKKRLKVNNTVKLFKTDKIFEISAEKNIGLSALKKSLGKSYLHSKKINNNYPTITRLRHQKLLQKAKKSLSCVVSSLEQQLSGEFIALDLSSAISSIEEITGKKVAEDILDKIFNDFCIGK